MTAPARTPAIAVVGLAALFPGSHDVAGLWRDILRGVDRIGDVPPTHWLPEDYYDPDPAAPDRTYCKRGAFLSPVQFDPLEFGVPPAIVPATDTSQLLALIVARAALQDHAGGPLAAAVRARTSVILGVTSGQELLGTMVSRLQRPVWQKALRELGWPEDQVEAACARIAASYVPWVESSFPGLLGNVVAGRVANRFDLGGTNLVTDAACASTLAAVHAAIHELAAGDADLVLTGGVETSNDIFMFTCFSKTPALSPTGDCRPFSAAADGTMLGEGLGMLVLKRLADAERDGDRVHAVIRGVGSSSDGRARSIYAPVPDGQARALRRAYAAADVDPATVELLEAHGTGTVAGDLAEVRGLQQVFDPAGRPPWCALGSIKSQIGHTKAAAGAAGLLKAILALSHRALPPTIKVDRPDPRLGLETSAFYLNTAARPWIASPDHPRRAGVSSFGFGGTNFHVVLEEYGGPAPRPPRADASPGALVLLSAGTAAELAAACRAAADAPGSLAWRARASHPRFDRAALARLAVVARDEAELAAALLAAAAALDAGAPPPPAVRAALGPPAPGGLALAFPGQGSQHLGMGAALALHLEPARRVWDEAAACLPGQVRLHDVAFPPPAFTDAARAQQRARLTATEWAQPALAAAGAAALAVLDACGVRPDATFGHSFGELTALHAAGALDLRSLLRAARIRGELMRDAAAVPGAMTAVSAAPADLAPALAAHPDVVLANLNAPRQVVLAGPTAAIDRLEADLRAAGLPAQRLAVATAFHSPLVAPAVPAFAAALAGLPLAAPRVPVIACSEAAPYPDDPAEIRAWLSGQLARPVRFVDQVERLHARGIRTFVEVGPGNVLSGLVARILDGRPHRVVALDDRHGDGYLALLRGLGELAVAGHPVDLTALTADLAPPRAPEPASARMTLPICGANYGKLYPPPGGAAALPGPNPPVQKDSPSAPVPQATSRRSPVGPPAPQDPPRHAPQDASRPSPASPPVPQDPSRHAPPDPSRPSPASPPVPQDPPRHAPPDPSRPSPAVPSVAQDPLRQPPRAAPVPQDTSRRSPVGPPVPQDTSAPRALPGLQDTPRPSPGGPPVPRDRLVTDPSSPRPAAAGPPRGAPAPLAAHEPAPGNMSTRTDDPQRVAPPPPSTQPRSTAQPAAMPIHPTASPSPAWLAAHREIFDQLASAQTAYQRAMADTHLAYLQVAHASLSALHGGPAAPLAFERTGLTGEAPPPALTAGPPLTASPRLEPATQPSAAHASSRPAAHAQISHAHHQPAPPPTHASSHPDLNPAAYAPHAQQQPAPPPTHASSHPDLDPAAYASHAQHQPAPPPTHAAPHRDLDPAAYAPDAHHQPAPYASHAHHQPAPAPTRASSRPDLDPAAHAPHAHHQPAPPLSATRRDPAAAAHTSHAQHQPAPLAHADPQPAPSSSVAAPRAIDPTTSLLAVVADKTGYPVDMLRLDMTLESDLGIDSIKRVEILSALRERHPALPDLSPAALGDLRTLGHVADLLRPAGPAAPTVDPAEILRAVVADKTGYPVDMLRLDMTLESDLGIDSIKRVEILSALRERHPALPDLPPTALGDLRTLADIVALLSPGAGTAADSAVTSVPDARTGLSPGTSGSSALASASAPLTSLSPATSGSSALASAPDARTGLSPGTSGSSALASASAPITSLSPGTSPASSASAPINNLSPGTATDSALTSASAPFTNLSPGTSGASALSSASAPLTGLSPASAVASAPDAITDLSPGTSGSSAPVVPAIGRHVPRLCPAEAAGFRLPHLGPGPVVVTDDGEGVAGALAAELRARGLDVTVVTDSDAVPRDARALIVLDGLAADDGLDAGLDAARRTLAYARRFAAGAGERAFVTVQDTGGRFGLDGAARRPGYAGLAGFAKTAAREWPAVVCRAVDLERAGRPAADLAADLARELLHGGLELEVGLAADGTRWTVAAALEPADAAPVALPVDGPWVLTGGARGITPDLAEALARRGVRRLALLGRTAVIAEPACCAGVDDEPGLLRALLADDASLGPAAVRARVADVVRAREVRRTLARLAAAGADVSYHAVDLCDRPAVAAALAEVRAAWGPIVGLVHAAGVLADRALADKTDADLDRVLAPKVAGLQALLAAAADDPVRALVVFSSIAARTGNAGQADYAAANEVLNDLAWAERARRGDACRVKALGWGPWRGGMVGPALARRFAARGVPLIDAERGAAMLLAELERAPAGDVEVVLGALEPGLEDRRIAAELAPADAALPDLRDHAPAGVPVVPIALAVEWFARAAAAAHPGRMLREVRGLRVLRGLKLPDLRDRDVRLHLALERVAADRWRATLTDAPGAPGLRAELECGPVARVPAPQAPLPAPAAYGGPLFHGPAFQVLGRPARLDPDGAAAPVAGALAQAWPGAHASDPAALDGALQLALLWLARAVGGRSLPLAIDRVALHAAGPWPSPAACALRAGPYDRSHGTCSIDLVAPDGRALASLSGVELVVYADPRAPRDTSVADAHAPASAADEPGHPDAHAPASAADAHEPASAADEPGHPDAHAPASAADEPGRAVRRAPGGASHG